MLLDILLWSLVAAVLLQPTEARVYAAALFAGPAVLHSLFLGHLDGLAYYGSAAVVDLAVLWAVGRIALPSATTIAIQRICLASIVLNAMGWGLWAAYLPPTVYNAAFVMLYTLALIILLQKDRADVGRNSVDREHPGLRLPAADRHPHLHGHGGPV